MYEFSATARTMAMVVMVMMVMVMMAMVMTVMVMMAMVMVIMAMMAMVMTAMTRLGKCIPSEQTFASDAIVINLGENVPSTHSTNLFAFVTV